ncbi:MAG TPA: type II toxin-antitoxin system prevent-host-death family antitoxin [Dongiaceae bacterium]|jgi:prevent-host-death family protein
MKVSVSDAKSQLTDLLRRAEAGDEVIFTRHGEEVARLVPIHPVTTRKARRALLQEVRESGRVKARAGVSAARSQDFLYGDDGMPE